MASDEAVSKPLNESGVDVHGAEAFFHCISRVGRVMEQVMDFDRMLLAIIQECARLLECEAASLAIYDEKEQDLIFVAAAGGVEDKIVHWRMAMGKGIVGTVAQTRQPLIVNDPLNDPRWFGKIDQTMGFTTRNLAAVPMVRKDMLIGVLEALNRQNPQGFSRKDLIMLQFFADQVAIAIENHRLIRARQESEKLATFALALTDIGHTIKNILMRLEFPLTLIDTGLEKRDWNIMDTSWMVLKTAVGDIGGLVRAMLDYARRSTPEFKETDVARLIGELADSYRPEAESKGIRLEYEGQESGLLWTLDDSKLKEALQNLVGNAIEAISAGCGTKILLKVELASQGERLCITVSDDGPGIPAETRKRIFDPFFTTKKSKGTGLGLANARKGVEEHGGQILLQSEEGKGASFLLQFPKSRPAV